MTLQPIMLFLCPTCNKYTIHLPRLTMDGHWVVDHKLVEQTFYHHATVTLPYEWCRIDTIALTKSENFTRTVIRV